MVNRDSKQRSLLSSAFLGGVTGGLVVTALLYGCAAMIQKEMLPYALLREAVVASAFLGAALAGVISASRQGRGVLPAGISAGIVLFALLSTIAVLLAKTQPFQVMTLRLFVCCLTGSGVGGVLCVSKKHKTTKYR